MHIKHFRINQYLRVRIIIKISYHYTALEDKERKSVLNVF